MGNQRAWIVYGARGHGHAIVDALLEQNALVAGFVDDDAAIHGQSVFSWRVHDFQWLERESRHTAFAVALAIGDNHARKHLALRCANLPVTIASVLHPKAMVSKLATIAEGAAILAGAIVNANASVSTGAIINSGSIVEHDTYVGAFAHVSPNAVLAGGAHLGELSQLGAGAVIIDDVHVGARTIIGAGAVVTSNIPDDVVAFGVPARITRSSK